MDNFVNLNGRILNPLAQQIQTDSIGIVMNEGVFETMRMIKGNIPLAKYHLERLFSGMQILGLDANEKFSPEFLQDEIYILCKKNNRLESSRIRLQVFRSDLDSAQQENFLSNYLIQNWHLDETNILQGPLKFGIDIFPHMQKVIDKFSSLKSTPCALYRMATDWARDNDLNACLILNQEGRVCDGNIYNVFSIFNGVIYTPPLTEGCVAGVLRRFLLKRGKSLGVDVVERAMNVDDLLQAEELFLTNAVRGIQSVHSFRNKLYKSDLTRSLSRQLSSFDEGAWIDPMVVDQR